MTVNKFNSNEWIQTDTLQWINQENENEFSVLTLTFETEKKVNFNEVRVNLNDYTEKELENEIHGYYDSLQEVKETYKEAWKQIVAECIAEQDQQKDMSYTTADLEEAYIFMKDCYNMELNFNEL